MWLLAWPVFCILVGLAARSHFNRSLFGWAALSFLISPMFGFLFLCAAGKKSPGQLLVAAPPPPPLPILEPRTDLIRAEARRRIEPRLVAALFLAVGLVAAAPAARAGEGLTFGGATLCSVFLQGSPQSMENWGSWIMGYWSGLNSMAATRAAAWTGESLGGQAVLVNTVSECVANTRQTIQDAVNVAYSKAQAAGQ